MASTKVKYWLFQSNPKVFRLKEALAADALKTFTIKAHKKHIKVGDKVILWQSGHKAGCYALATIMEMPKSYPIDVREKPFFKKLPDSNPRAILEINYNLWNRPITKELLPGDSHFNQFYAGIPGTNFKATSEQYEALVAVVKGLDVVVHEPAERYQISKPLPYALNTILQGPPGTGKTYQTVNYALSIIENRSLKELAIETRTTLRDRFEAYQEEGRVQFLTFHQSYAYEDFVEGIKPFVQNDNILYGIEDGIFKQICQEARECLVEALANTLPEEALNIEFNQLYRAFLQYIKSDNFSAFETPSERKILLHRVLRFGNLSVRKGKSFSTFTISKHKLKKLYHQLNRQIIAYEADVIRSIIGNVDTNAYWGIYQALIAFEEKLLNEKIDALDLDKFNALTLDIKEVSNAVLKNCRKYVLIIDEINRGNVPSIFGELISLLEPDKREGGGEMIKTILPYSKELFSIPPNLYIIGTMNTADRNIEAMDMALRRRFHFIEMSPQPALLRPAIEAGVNLERLLSAMNIRIEALLNNEYLIGHAYFMNVQTLDDLIELFDKKIIPLLKVYFFGDLNKIGLVLGKAFFKNYDMPDTDIFSDFDPEFGIELKYKKPLQLKRKAAWREIDFIRIYDKKYEV